MQKVREAERDRQFSEYKDRIGEIVNGTGEARRVRQRHRGSRVVPRASSVAMR